MNITNYIGADNVPTTTFERRVYTIEEIMCILDIGKNAAYALAKSGAFRCVKVGRHYRVSRQSFDNWLEGAKGGVSDGR